MKMRSLQTFIKHTQIRMLPNLQSENSETPMDKACLYQGFVHSIRITFMARSFNSFTSFTLSYHNVIIC